MVDHIYVYRTLCALWSVLLILRRSRRRKRAARGPRPSPAYVTYQRLYITPFLFAIAAMLLRGNTERHKWYNVVGYAAEGIMAISVGNYADTYGTRRVCALYGVLQILSNRLSRWGRSNQVLIVGQILHGFGRAILWSCFEASILGEQKQRGFARDLIPFTATVMSFSTCVAGVVCSILLHTTSETNHLNLSSLSAFLSIIACFYSAPNEEGKKKKFEKAPFPKPNALLRQKSQSSSPVPVKNGVNGRIGEDKLVKRALRSSTYSENDAGVSTPVRAKQDMKSSAAKKPSGGLSTLCYSVFFPFTPLRLVLTSSVLATEGILQIIVDIARCIFLRAVLLFEVIENGGSPLDGRVRLAVYFSFALCSMMGTTVFGWIADSTGARGASCEKFIYTILAASFSVAATTHIIAAVTSNVALLLASFLVFEVSCGIIVPALTTLRGFHSPDTNRAGLKSIARVPVALVLICLNTSAVAPIPADKLDWLRVSFRLVGGLLALAAGLTACFARHHRQFSCSFKSTCT